MASIVAEFGSAGARIWPLRIRILAGTFGFASDVPQQSDRIGESYDLAMHYRQPAHRSLLLLTLTIRLTEYEYFSR